jgi:hypothetical protein
VQDEDVRAACMAHLSVLAAEFGEDIPYTGGLAVEPRIHKIRNSGQEIAVATLDVEKEPKALLADVDVLADRVAQESSASHLVAA